MFVWGSLYHSFILKRQLLQVKCSLLSFFSSNTLNISSSSLLTCKISTVKFTESITEAFLHVTSLGCFQNSPSLWLLEIYYISWCRVILFHYIWRLGASWIKLFIDFTKSEKMSVIMYLNMLSSLFSSLLPVTLWIIHIYTWWCPISPIHLFSLFLFLIFGSPNWIILNDLSLGSFYHFIEYAIKTLLNFPVQSLYFLAPGFLILLNFYFFIIV